MGQHWSSIICHLSDNYRVWIKIMKNHLTPLAIIVGAIIISISTYVAITKPQQDMIKKKMNACYDMFLIEYGAKSLKELENEDTDYDMTARELVEKECRYKVYTLSE